MANATLPEPSTIAGRHLFYNQSGTSTRFDGNSLAINASDDNAIATDKTTYLWEDAGAATFANVYKAPTKPSEPTQPAEPGKPGISRPSPASRRSRSSSRRFRSRLPPMR